MRLAALALAAALAACATASGGLPAPFYADAASRGALASFLAGRPTQAQVDRATENWSHALGDSVACGVAPRAVIDAGLVGALEMGAMSAAMSRGDEAEVREGVRRYVRELFAVVTDRRARPSEQRCDALESWAPRTADQGREAVARARRNGLMDDDYGLLLDLLSR
ncbi:MAG TPA: hypothetical protein VEA80_06455 [Vitreimonas sp.]|uniref:hypothetical protein n=1 Tax=Vitreimonas sp. TaxID=3069702 RepID=UPI002D32067E|nr:hypothetical protein [Vitreimonas sp.]HYD87095.1 hypothetical protein [Vitreimonas sp.]